jgi:GT2 family glycosyltransferase
MILSGDYSGRIAVCIPAHGFSEKLSKAIGSIRGCIGKNIPEFHIIVSNSGPEFKCDDDVTILCVDSDDYWVGAVAKLYEYCQMSGGYEYVLLMNHDCYLDANCLSEMMAFVKGRADLVVHSLLCYTEDPERVWWGGSIAKCMSHYEWLYGDTLIQMIPSDPYEIDSAMGQCLLMPIRAAQSKYLHPLLLTHFYGDPVQSVEMKRDGFKLYMIPSAIAYTDQSDQFERTKSLDSVKSYKELYKLFFQPYSRFSLKTIFWGEYFLQECFFGKYLYPIISVLNCFFRQSAKVLFNRLSLR